MNPRSGSSKLIPRSAATIEERVEEGEDDLKGGEPKKQSLFDLLNAELRPFSERAHAHIPTKEKGLVPAVLLGTSTPPQDGPTRIQPDGMPPMVNMPNRQSNFLDSENEEEKRVKPRTSAQELADFFSNTPPAVKGVPPLKSAKSNKGVQVVDVESHRKEERGRCCLSSSIVDLIVI